jgi:hypothetical protein
MGVAFTARLAGSREGTDMTIWLGLGGKDIRNSARSPNARE